MKKLCKSPYYSYNKFIVGESYEFSKKSKNCIVVFPKKDDLGYPFINEEINKYFYTEKELRKMKLEKLKSSNEKTM